MRWVSVLKEYIIDWENVKIKIPNNPDENRDAL